MRLEGFWRSRIHFMLRLLQYACKLSVEHRHQTFAPSCIQSSQASDIRFVLQCLACQAGAAELVQATGEVGAVHSDNQLVQSVEFFGLFGLNPDYGCTQQVYINGLSCRSVAI